jgi:two-component system response regulator FixJ
LSASNNKAIIYVVDDERDVAEDVASFLKCHEFEARVCIDWESLRANLDEPVAGVIILDLQMPEMDGLEFQDRLKQDGFQLPIIFLSGRGDIAAAVSTLKRGAVDFLQKPIHPETLLKTVEKAIALALEQKGEDERKREIYALFSRLTPREREIMTFLSHGYTAKEIGKALSISPRTAEIHRTRVMEKLSADGLAELVALYLEYQSKIEHPTSEFH